MAIIGLMNRVAKPLWLDQNDPANLEKVFERSRERFVRQAQSIVKDLELAEDVVQNSYTKVYCFHQAGKIQNYVYGALVLLVRTTVIKFSLSAIKNRARNSQRELSLHLAGNDAEREVSQQIEKTRLEQALAQLPAIENRAITLVWLRGLSYKEAAQEEKTTRPAINSRISRGLQRLKQLLRDTEAEI